jgi:hypothetical protein
MAGSNGTGGNRENIVTEEVNNKNVKYGEN